MGNPLLFFVVLILCVLLYWVFVPHKFRTLFLLVISIATISLVSLKLIFYLLFNIVLVYWVGCLMLKYKKDKKILLQLILFWLIGSLCFFKYINIFFTLLHKLNLSFYWQARIPKVLLPLGISYIIFRSIHYIVEIYRKKIVHTSFINFACYILFLPTFLAGPVERYNNFKIHTLGKNQPDFSSINYGLYRIGRGLIKKFFFADMLASFIFPILSVPDGVSPLFLVILIYGLAIQIYMDFSGYTDIAVGMSRLFGYKIIENFKRPYLQKNIVLFWRNWHISVYTWIRDYFFFPFFGSRATTFKLYLGIFMSMVVFHLWHEGTMNFLILGVYHGLGLIIWQLFQQLKKKNYFLQKLVSYNCSTVLSVFLTFNFVSFGFIFFHFKVDKAFTIIKLIFN